VHVHGADGDIGGYLAAIEPTHHDFAHRRGGQWPVGRFQAVDEGRLAARRDLHDVENVLAHDRLARAAQHPLGRTVDRLDAAVEVEDEDPVAGVLELDDAAFREFDVAVRQAVFPMQEDMTRHARRDDEQTADRQ